MEPRAAIESFYKSFAARDAEGMVACYHPDVSFRDPVFLELDSPRVRAMWRMLCERGKDLRIEASGIEASGDSGKAHWEAWYSFSATGRKVHNVIDATFRFKDGLIVRHDDSFGFWRWTRMALGPAGVLLGWTPPIQGKIRRTAAKGLADFMAKQPRSPLTCRRARALISARGAVHRGKCADQVDSAGAASMRSRAEKNPCAA